ncbi:hypothetical protein DEI97_017010 [Curtobacterium sp. MCLR17_032]|uniref:hypothetical protein n=1 Tax=Curtobacterium sp. MCLR17_032 TaxID=2175650 RepID=UPI0011B3EEEB|nr:hypothetical protein [Curtobacterium sp. MCLR17_032]WIE61421.1 hypothetical protein DEI97_017010 [Curtobacterium sp. MCLR17_032]
MKYINKVALAGVSTVSLLIAGVALAPAAMADEPAITDGASTLLAVAPGTVVGDTATTQISVQEPASGRARLRAAAPLAPTIAVTSTPKDSEPLSVQFALDGATTTAGTSDGVTSFATADATVARYVSDAGTGARVLTAYAAPQRSYESRTTFTFVDGEHVAPRPGGGYYFKIGDDIVGALDPAWAVDADGTSLETGYRWDGSTLVQDVQVPDDAAFPVVADPAWSYTWTAVVKKGSPADLHKRMHDCFNCIFPVSGAPKAFPTYHQKLPLTVLTMSFACIFEQEQFLPAGNPLFPGGDFGFYFTADKGHVDGAGSTISFDWWTGADNPVAGEKMRFTVAGYVLNEDVPGGQPLYRAGAKSEWGKFVNQYMLSMMAPDGSWYWTN